MGYSGSPPRNASRTIFAHNAARNKSRVIFRHITSMCPFIVFKKNGDEVGWPSSQFETNISKCDIWASFFRTFLSNIPQAQWRFRPSCPPPQPQQRTFWPADISAHLIH
ncbi:hypothetical protein CEXT_716471, partial [Caerostris extrusa]